MPWKNRPKFIDYCPDESGYIMFIDENGDSNLKYIKKCLDGKSTPDKNSIYFTATGCIIHQDHLKVLIDKVTKLKNKYWEDGCYLYKSKIKKVCFHSREIRKKDGPFFLKYEVYSNFTEDLTKFLGSVDAKIISININKQLLCQTYTNPYDPYKISSEFLIERYTKFLSNKDEKGIIVLESRGKKEDKFLLEHLKNVIASGTGNGSNVYVNSYKFKKYIYGIYFNPKWSKDSNWRKSYYGLEIADLFSYPIHSYVRSNCTIKTRPYEILESKLMNYPNHLGFGLKIFPKK